MKNKISFLASCVIVLVFVYHRIYYSDIRSPHPLKLTTWDALGYYLYLPTLFIYQDVQEMAWFHEMDQKYSMSGGSIYQFSKYKNGNYVFKYLGGVAIIELPFFIIGHTLAALLGYEQDGFSPPYQYALGFGILFLCMLCVFLLRHILLLYFGDVTTVITLLLLMLASNCIQYIAIDNAQSHGPLFCIYVLILFTTIKWHREPSGFWAAATGFLIGLASISRPPEAISILIPILWNTHSKEHARVKWEQVRKHRNHITLAFLFGFLGVLPQLIYWQYITGFFIYDVGSAWDFLTPHLRVLFGGEKGWFIYTPVTVLFVSGMFFMKKYPFRKAVIYFCLINIYIIISWRNWRYGGSYSTRALVQSYPVFALSLGSLVEKMNQHLWRRLALIGVGILLIYVNLFQIRQYNNTILHYDDMNYRYYRRIFLKKHLSPLDLSLMDNSDWIRNEDKYLRHQLLSIDSIWTIQSKPDSIGQILKIELTDSNTREYWLKIEAIIKPIEGKYGAFLNSKLQQDDFVKKNRIRLYNPAGYYHSYAFYVKIPDPNKTSDLNLYISSKNPFTGTIEKITILILVR